MRVTYLLVAVMLIAGLVVLPACHQRLGKPACPKNCSDCAEVVIGDECKPDEDLVYVKKGHCLYFSNENKYSVAVKFNAISSKRPNKKVGSETIPGEGKKPLKVTSGPGVYFYNVTSSACPGGGVGGPKVVVGGGG